MSATTEDADLHPTTADVRPHYVYRLFDAAGALLYVGITCDVTTRMYQHSKEQPWWDEVDNRSVEEVLTRADAFFLEAAAILAERPRYNKDIPTVERCETLRSRATMASEESLRKLIDALKRQASYARVEVYEAQLEAQKLRQEVDDLRANIAGWKALAAEGGREDIDFWKKQSDFWKGQAEEAKKPHVFVVEGPTCHRNHYPATPAVTPSPTPAPAQRTRLFTWGRR